MGKSSKNTGRSRGRKLIRLLALVGIGVLVRQKLQAPKAPAAEPYVPRTPAPAEPPQAVIPTSPVEPEAPAPVTPDPEPEAIEQLETEAPVPPIAPEDSLTSFFDEVMNETEKGSRRN